MTDAVNPPHVAERKEIIVWHEHTRLSIVVRTLIDRTHSLGPNPNLNHHNKLPNPNINSKC